MAKKLVLIVVDGMTPAAFERAVMEADYYAEKSGKIQRVVGQRQRRQHNRLATFPRRPPRRISSPREIHFCSESRPLGQSAPGREVPLPMRLIA